jgi:hypothetical protein
MCVQAAIISDYDYCFYCRDPYVFYELRTEFLNAIYMEFKLQSFKCYCETLQRAVRHDALSLQMIHAVRYDVLSLQMIHAVRLKQELAGHI